MPQGLLEGLHVIVDFSVPNIFYIEEGDFLISKPCVKVMTFQDRLYHTDTIPYCTDLDASVAYARAMEQLNNPNVEFCDNRVVPYHEYYPKRYIEINPDTVCDFTALPFPDKSFKLVVFATILI